ncbi:hypothetical protein ACFLZZ_04635 [Nanoarchaeota archaeon]
MEEENFTNNENKDEGFVPISEMLGEKSGKAEVSWFDSEKLVYGGVALVALVALVAFIFSVAPNTSDVQDTQTVESILLEYSLELENGSVIVDGEDSFPLGAVGDSFGFSDKVDKEIEGMVKGEEKTILLGAEDAFGEYDEEKVSEINRTISDERKSEVDKAIEMPLGAFKQEFIEDPEVGKTYEVEGIPWGYKVLSLEGDVVTLSQEVEEGQIAPLNEVFFLLISEVGEDSFVTLLTAENQTIETDNGKVEILTHKDVITETLIPEIGQTVVVDPLKGSAKVLSFDEEVIVLDYNSEFADKNIVFKVKIL